MGIDLILDHSHGGTPSLLKLFLIVIGILVFIALMWFVVTWGTSSPEERANWPAGSGWDD